LRQAISFEPAPKLDEEFSLGPIRATFASYWEARYNLPLPIQDFRRLLEPPIPIATIFKFSIPGDYVPLPQLFVRKLQ
jgi:hypothetical protein